MDEYIDRRKFEESVEERYCKPCKEYEKDYFGCLGLGSLCRACWVADMIDEVDCFQPDDVAPVVHGRWEPGNPICPVCGGNKFKDLDADIWCDWMPDFCPNCGAKMDGGGHQ